MNDDINAGKTGGAAEPQQDALGELELGRVPRPQGGETGPREALREEPADRRRNTIDEERTLSGLNIDRRQPAYHPDGPGYAPPSDYDPGYGPSSDYDPGYGPPSDYDPGYGPSSDYDPDYDPPSEKRKNPLAIALICIGVLIVVLAAVLIVLLMKTDDKTEDPTTTTKETTEETETTETTETTGAPSSTAATTPASTLAPLAPTLAPLTPQAPTVPALTVPANVAPQYYIVATQTDDLLIRDAPSRTGNILGKIRKGTRIPVYGLNEPYPNGSWAYIMYNGTVGWVAYGYLSPA